MMKKRPLRPLFALAAVATAILGLTTKPANAETVLEEQFIYEAGTNIDGHNGGVGFDGEWISTISHGRIYEVQTAGLSFPMLPVAGNSLSRYGSAGRAQAHRLISGDSQTALTGDGTTVWFSVLFQEPSGQYRHTSFLFGTEAFTTGGTPELAASGDGFGFTIQAAPDGASQGNGSINALAFHDGTLPTVVAGTFTPVPQEATNLIVGKINWKASGTPDELFLFNITDLSIGPAEDTAFASITDLDFGQSAFDTIAMWDSNNGIIDEIRFGTTFADVMGVLRCPSKLSATGGEDGVTLTWLNGEEMPTSVQILRDGEEIESAAPVDPPTYTDTDAQPGLIEYELIFTMPGEEACKPLTLTYHAGITELAGRESEDGEVILTWKNNMGYEGIDITRNGKVIATVDGSEEEYIDSTPPFAGLISYSVVPTEGTSGPATVEIKLCNCYDSGCIPIANPGFEEPDVANEDYLALWDTDGWGFYLGDGGATVEVGAWDVNIGYKGIAPGGENVGYAYATNVGEAGAGFAQILEETLTANSKYTLAVEVGNTDGYQWGGYRVQLLAGGDAQYIDNGDEYADEVAGGELPSEDNTSVDIAPDTFETVTVTYTYDPSEHQHLLGTSLQIRLLSLGEETDFDCVRLKVETTGTAVYFQRGDVNADGTTDISDAICTLSYLFGPEGNSCRTNVAQCMDAADSNDDGKLNIADAIYLLNYQFAAGPALPEPFAKCGVDQTTKNDPLDCKSFPICEELE